MRLGGIVIAKRQLVIIASVVLLVVSLTTAGVANASAITRQMHVWKLLPEPEKLTELYFTDHAKLPATYQADAAQTVAFTIHNLEYKTVSYHYTVYQTSQDGSQKVALSSGTALLRQNAYGSESLSVNLQDLGPSRVSIALSPVNETISYLVVEE